MFHSITPQYRDRIAFSGLKTEFLACDDRTTLVVPTYSRALRHRAFLDRELRTSRDRTKYPELSQFVCAEEFFQDLANKFNAMRDSLILPVEKDFSVFVLIENLPPPKSAYFHQGASTSHKAVVSINFYNILSSLYSNKPEAGQYLNRTFNHELLHWTDIQFFQRLPKKFSEESHSSLRGFLLLKYIKARTEGFTTIIENDGPVKLVELKEKLKSETEKTAEKIRLFQSAPDAELPSLLSHEKTIDMNRGGYHAQPFNHYKVGKLMFSAIYHAFRTDSEPEISLINLLKQTRGQSLFEFTDLFRMALDKLGLNAEYEIFPLKRR